jgi:hypothetical protein
MDLGDYVMMDFIDRNNLDEYSLRNRAQNIRDLYGAKPLLLEEYSARQGSGFTRGLIAGSLLGVAAFAVATVIPPLAASAVLIGLAAGAVGLFGSMAVKSYSNRQHYEEYLTDFAGRARAAHDAQQRTPAQQQTASPTPPAPQQQPEQAVSHVQQQEQRREAMNTANRSQGM